MVDPPDLGASSLLHGPRHRPAPRHRRPRRRPSATLGSSGPSRRPSRPILVSLFLLSLLGLVAGHVLPQSPPGHAAAAVASTTHPDQVKLQQYRAHYVVDNNDEGLATAEAAQDLAQGTALNRFRVAAADTSSSITGQLHRFGKRGQLYKRAECESKPMAEGERIAFGILVPVLVVLSGIFAGLTLGYMSLDETQLHVLSTTGTEVQRARARKIIPIRKDGHLLLTTLLIANMITNETLPIIFDPLISNPIGSVAASIVLIVIFAELIPQSTCSRYGLVIGAYMAFPTRIVILVLWPVAFPVSRILHWVLGPHHGIVYRRAELKELVAIHAASGGRGGDLKGDTVMIVGGALDLQEKVVRQAMTPIDSVFMLPFTATLDYPTLEKVVRSGHSRIPIYQEFDVPVAALQNTRSGGATPTKKKLGPLLGSFAKKASADTDSSTLAPPAAGAGAGATTGDGEPGDDEVKTVKRKKIIGTLLVKSCVLLDPEDAIPVSSMVINALPTVPGDEPLLNVLNAFQEGRSHMAIVSARPRNRTMLNDSIADLGSHSNLYRSSQGPPGQAAAAAAAPPPPPGASAAPRVDGLGNIDEEKQTYFGRSNSSSAGSGSDSTAATATTGKDGSPTRAHKSRRSIWSRRLGLGKDGGEALREQSVPSDATITDEKANAAAAAAAAPPLSAMPQLTPINSRMSASAEDHHGWPLGIITLEDVLEELLGEEILDEYDDRGNEEQDFRTLNPPPSPEHIAAIRNHGDKAVQPGADDGGVGAAAAAAGDGDNGAPAVVAKDTHTLALPAPALGASHGAAADDAATAAAATATTTTTTTSKPTVLNRLGITRRRSAKDPNHSQGHGQGQGRSHQNSQRQASDSEPQLGAGVSRRRTETDVAPASPLVASPVPIATDAAAPPLPLDYFGATAARSRPPRSSSVPPTAPGSSYSSAGVTPAHSRPPSPAGAPGAALKSPANRPVVIRTQDPSSGVQKTTIASEGLLRGRQQTTAAAAAAAASSSTSGAMTPPIASSAIPSRSQTPAGEGGASSSRGSRFKSQAAGGHLIGGQWISPQSSARKTSGGTKQQQQQPATNRSMTAALAAQQDLSDSIGSLRSSDQPESTVEHTGADDGDGGGDSTPPSRAH